MMALYEGAVIFLFSIIPNSEQIMIGFFTYSVNFFHKKIIKISK